MMRYPFLFLLLIISTLELFAQADHKHRLNGDTYYQEQDYLMAQAAYGTAVEENPTSMKSHYNLANSLYRQGSFSKAAEAYEKAAALAEDEYTKSKIYYNMGNAQLQHGDMLEDSLNQIIQSGELEQNAMMAQDMYKRRQELYNEARNAYKNALRANPQDYDAKNNLAYTQKKIEEIEQQQQNQQQQQQQQQQEQQNQEQQNQNNQQENPIQNNPQQPPKEEPMQPNDVERLMQIIENEDKKVQEKIIQRMQGTRVQPDKDW